MLATILLLATTVWAKGNGGKKKTGVNVKPFLNTHAGANTWTTPDSDVLIAPYLGAQAGLRFNQKRKKRPRVSGLTRVSYTRTVGLTSNGTDVRFGVFAGPAWKYLRLRTGPDYFYNVAQWGGTAVPEVSGLAWPVEARLGKPKFQLTAGIQPSFYRGDTRQGVDWGAVPQAGIGDEMTIYGVFSAGKLTRLELRAAQTTTAYGTQRSLGVGFKIGRG